MNATILNRDFQHPADGWYQIEALGEHPNRASGVVQIIDEEAAESIVRTFNSAAQAGTLRHGHELLIDHEHFSDQPDKETRAYGWLTQLQKREDGIYAQVRWSKTGKEAVDGGDYRFFSTEYDPADLKVLNVEGKLRRVRPLRLDGLSLTNMNNNRGQKPITNRRHDAGFHQFPQGSRSSAATLADEQNKQQRTNVMKSVATKLGLSAEASEESILAELTKVMNRVTAAEAELAPAKNRVTELETLNVTLLGEQIDADLATAGIKDEKIINRYKPLLSDTKHFKNREERVSFITDLGKGNGAGAGQQQAQKKLHNREAKAPGQDPAGEAPTMDGATVTRIQNRAMHLRKESPTLTMATAYSMAQREEEANKK